MQIDPYEGVERLYAELGESKFTQLVSGFYARVRADDILAPMYPDDDWEGAEERLRDFLVGRCGGPPRYVEQRGHPRLRMRHARFAVDGAARDRWMSLMTAALEEIELDDAPREALRRFLDATATFLINR